MRCIKIKINTNDYAPDGTIIFDDNRQNCYQKCGDTWEQLDCSSKVDLSTLQTAPKAIGFVCRCGKKHLFTPYVYAHWNNVLTLICDAKDGDELCDLPWVILRGVVRLSPDKEFKATYSLYEAEPIEA